MATDPEMASFDAFWPHYVRSHSRRSTRVLHAVGGVVAMGAVAAGLTSRRRRGLLVLAPVVGFGLAWLGHLVFEGKRPCIFEHPRWALRAGLRMVGMMATGTMSGEVARVMAEAEGEASVWAPASPAEENLASPPRPGAAGDNGARRPMPPDPHTVN